MASVSEAECCGWVTKKATSLVSKLSWKRRYLRVSREAGKRWWTLSYYTSDTAPTPKKAPIAITSASLAEESTLHVSGPAEAELVLRFGGAGDKCLFLRLQAADVPTGTNLPDGILGTPTTPEEVRDAWLSVLRYAISGKSRAEAEGRETAAAEAEPVSPAAGIGVLDGMEVTADKAPVKPATAAGDGGASAGASPPAASGPAADSADSNSAAADQAAGTGPTGPGKRKPRLPPPPRGGAGGAAAAAPGPAAASAAPEGAKLAKISTPKAAAAGSAGGAAAAGASAASPRRGGSPGARSPRSPGGLGARSLVPQLPSPEDWVATVMGSGSGGLDKLVGTQQPRHKSLADVVRELRKRKPTLLSVGGNDAGQLGIGTVNASGSPHPKEVKSLSAKYAPVAVSAGESHVACVTAGGSVMVWGDGDGGQLGVGEGLQRSPRPYLLKGLRQFKACSVACGSYHTLVSVEGGRVYAFGDGSGWGELGLATPRVCWEPTPVLGLPMDRGPPSVFCGRVTSGALFSDGSCYMWGCNATGQCGSAPPACADADATTRSALMQTTPALVEVDPALGLGSSRVVAAAAGDYFTLFVVGAERALVVAGWTNVSRADRELVTAGDRSTLWEAAGVSAGDDSIFALRHARESPLSGLRGEPSEEELAAADAPFPITAILDVSAGHRHGAAVRGNGVVLMVGRGLLGLPPDSAAACLSARRKDAVHDGDTAAGDAFVATTDFVRVPSLVLEGCVAVSCGADHTVVGTRSGRLLSFGAADVAQTGTGHYGWAIEPEACEAFAMPMHHVEAFSAGGCFTAAISYPGARGAAQERELATKWCDVWMRKALGRGLGERVYDKAEVAGEIDAIAAAMAREAGLGAVLMQVTADN